MAAPDFDGAWEAMLEAGRPNMISYEGWRYFFPHSEGIMVAVRAIRAVDETRSVDQWREAYQERYGKRFRG